MKKSTHFLAQAAMIAAIYAALTYAAASLGLAYGNIQLRFSEAMTLLAVFTPAAIPGLTIGCFLGNLGSPFGLIDILCGTFATFLASVMSYQLRKVRVKNVPWLSALPPVIMNALIVGFEIAWFMPEGLTWIGFAVSALEVGAGELIVCCGLGLPLAVMLEKTGSAKKIFERKNF